ncbi:hypothetical protein KUCAC02_023527 [Chaenocephalus aceratus]|uniref:Uncharacterized protein n=1 Tax=Chaenocephalus aceratus TaxID=36190 RepID=A0ACB9XQY7_CHAAC|nr:hypothetical protein KUCAC02_023527 [Chaenocephalus aceratus]
MDGYDKLKPYGSAINGCIDGVSRYVLWMEAYTTNSDPKVVASYFIKTVSGIGGCRERIRADRGTEQVSVEEMQMFLQRNHPESFAGERSVLCGRSTANQRIEGWWGTLRRQSAHFWMNLFQTLLEDGHFTGDFLDISLIQFCYLNLVQDELDEEVNTCSSHTIRPRSADDTASGRPVITYSFPEWPSAEDRLKAVAMEEVNLCLEACSPKGQLPCHDTVFELWCRLMAGNGWDDPADPFAAADLYILLRDEIPPQVFD